MFTGIIQACLPINTIKKVPGLFSFSLILPIDLMTDLKIGASVSIDGVCLTVTKIVDREIFFDAMQETLQLTSLGKLEAGQKVNVERSFLQGAEVGGHIISGHVHGIAKIINIEELENNHVVTFELPEGLSKYVFNKGFIALDGASLTVVDPNFSKNTLKVWFIPETLARTTFGFKIVGDVVNVEVEQATRVAVDTIERILPQYLSDLKEKKHYKK
ncbi:MAG: riboflavin synthase subunit alpha [Candidatus Magasanikbacteria bacterium]